MSGRFNWLAAALATVESPRLNWQFQPSGCWWPFAHLNTNFSGWNNPYGVYIVADLDGRAIRLGQGAVMARLRAHQTDRKICNPALGSLSVTWASVGALSLNGVERYLANELSPMVGEAFPNVSPIPVNLPAPLQTSPQRLSNALVRQYGR